MALYNLLGYSHSYSITSGKLWNYYRDEIDGADDDVSDGKSFEYKTKLIGNTPVWPTLTATPPWSTDGTQPPWQQQLPTPPLNTKITIPFKHFSNFW